MGKFVELFLGVPTLKTRKLIIISITLYYVKLIRIKIFKIDEI
jgi:hypothetical protein